MTSRRNFLTIAVALSTLSWAGITHAEPTFPSKPVKIVVPYTPGGAPDLIARLISAELGKVWGQPIVVENRPGAGGSIGTDYVAKATGDGYTLLSGGIGTHAINPALYKTIQYDPVLDFSPLTKVGDVANVIIVQKDFPANNLQELMTLIRANPGKYSYGTPGNGTSPHLAAALLGQMADIKLEHVPYKGSSSAMNDLLGGQIPMAFDNLTAGLPFIKDGKLKAIAVTTSTRSPLLPDVATIAESGVPGYELSAWAGFFAPKGLSPEIASKISRDIGTVLRKPEVVDQLMTMGVLSNPNTPEAFTTFVTSEGEKFRNLAKETNLQLG